MDLFFREMTILFFFAIVIGYIGYRLKIPLIVSYILTGLLVGPSGFQIIHDVHLIEVLSELGILLLLFIIGLEFSFLHLIQFKRYIFVGGLLQVLLTIFLFSLITWLGFDLPLPTALFIGFFVSTSSTAIVLKLLDERGELETPYGKLVLGILLFQDIAVIPMMLFIPFLSSSTSFLVSDIFLLLLKTVTFIGGAFLIQKFILPWFFRIIIIIRNKEIYFLTALLILSGMVLLSEWLDLSLGLGAFMAGLIIADSDYSHNTSATLLPFRDLFLSFFFISTGMILNVQILIQNLPTILAGMVILFLGKSMVIFAVALFMKLSLRVSVIAAFALFQIGEFSLILLKVGNDHGLVPQSMFQSAVALIGITMLITPFGITLGKKISLVGMIGRWQQRLDQFFRNAGSSTDSQGVGLSNHLIVVGFGVIGQSLVRAAKVAGIPYVIIEMNPNTVQKFREQGEPIIFGDATSIHLLESVNIKEATTLALTIPDIPGIIRIIKLTRSQYPHLHIVARARFTGQVPALLDAGADSVIPDEFEAALRMFRTVLKFHEVDDEVVELFMKQITREHYKLFRRKEG